jgi:hypothetical protein
MTNANRSAQVAREAILMLLSNEETARVSTAEDKPELAAGAEYLDLDFLDRGVQRASPATAVTMGHVLPRSAVRQETWHHILAQLAR